MQADGIAARRLIAQRLVGTPFPSAAAAVRGLLAVQSQDYPGATWALAQRVAGTTQAVGATEGAGATQADVDRAFDAGELVRTHVLRPTWHLVPPEDGGAGSHPRATPHSSVGRSR